MCASRSTTCAGRAPSPARLQAIGASTGYGLAARISAVSRGGARTPRFERPSEPSKPGTPGWHNSAAFHRSPRPRACTPAASTATPSPDARSSARSSRPSAPTWARPTRWSTRRRRAAAIHATGLHLGAQARAAPPAARLGYRPRGRARIHAGTGDADEIDATVAVMGGEDWQMRDRHAPLGSRRLAEGATTTALHPWVSASPRHLLGTAPSARPRRTWTARCWTSAPAGGARRRRPRVGAQAVVTQASSAIPMMPLYLSPAVQGHEGRRHARGLHRTGLPPVPRWHLRPGAAAGRRRPAARGRLGTGARPQARVQELWNQVETDNINELTDSPATSPTSCACSASRSRAWTTKRRSIRTRASTDWPEPRRPGACPPRTPASPA